MTFLIQIFYILFITAFIINVLYFFSLRRLFHLLKNKYPEKFKELGEPSLWWNNSPRNGIRIVRFLSSNDPLFSTEAELSRTRTFAIVFLFLGITIFITLLILFALFFFSGYKEFQGG